MRNTYGWAEPYHIGLSYDKRIGSYVWDEKEANGTQIRVRIAHNVCLTRYRFIIFILFEILFTHRPAYCRACG